MKSASSLLLFFLAEIGLYKAGIRGRCGLLDSAMKKQQRIRVRAHRRLQKGRGGATGSSPDARKI
jgi:hypothetical protein